MDRASGLPSRTPLAAPVHASRAALPNGGCIAPAQDPQWR